MDKGTNIIITYDDAFRAARARDWREIGETDEMVPLPAPTIPTIPRAYYPYYPYPIRTATN